MPDFAVMPDETLLHFIHGGNMAAFDTLVLRHHQRFYAMAYRWVLSKEDAQDIVQTAFLKLWSGKAKWNPRKNARFTTWFYRILYHQSMDIQRQRQRIHTIPKGLIPEAEAEQERAIIQDETQRRLHDMLQQLPDSQRVALQLFYFEQMSQKDIAAVLEVSVKAVESLLHRGKNRLRQYLTEDHFMEVADVSTR